MPRSGRIIVVEDDDTLRETLVEVMADEGHEVRQAANGREALDTMDGWEPNVIILDLMMPLMDAYEFRDHQRRYAAAIDARLLILSAARDIEVAAERLEASAWVAKPFRLSDVIGTVDRLLDEGAA